MQLIDHHLLRHSIGDLLDGVLDSHTRIGKYRSIGPNRPHPNIFTEGPSIPVGPIRRGEKTN
jgi:hypothetical protein